MDKTTYLHKRKARYMAQTLEAFEEKIEQQLPDECAGDVHSFKGLVRARFNALATDAAEILNLDTINGAAQDVRDRLSPTGRP